jgi:hypothetical protein
MMGNAIDLDIATKTPLDALGLVLRRAGALNSAQADQEASGLAHAGSAAFDEEDHHKNSCGSASARDGRPTREGVLTVLSNTALAPSCL